MLVVAERLSMFYIFLFLGWLLGRWKKDLIPQTGILSFVLVNLCLPSTIIRSFSENFTVDYFLHNGTALLFSTALLAVLHLACKFPAKALSKDPFERKVYEYSFVIPNGAYLGYPLVLAIFGSQGLTDYVLFTIPFAVYTYTYGYVLLSGKGQGIKGLFNSITIAILVGAILGLLQVKIPNVILQPIISAENCIGPLSMLLTGMVLSEMAPKSLVTDVKAYVMVALRLLVIPAVVFAVCKLLDLPQILVPALVYMAMPTGLNTIIFAKNAGRPPELGAKLAFLSHLLSILTLPLWLMLV